MTSALILWTERSTSQTPSAFQVSGRILFNENTLQFRLPRFAMDNVKFDSDKNLTKPIDFSDNPPKKGDFVWGVIREPVPVHVRAEVLCEPKGAVLKSVDCWTTWGVRKFYLNEIFLDPSSAICEVERLKRNAEKEANRLKLKAENG